MRVVEAQELGSNAGEILRQVEGGETVEVMRHGQVVARMVPADGQPVDRDANGAWSELLRLIDVIGAQWPEGVSAQDAINDVRRDL